MGAATNSDAEITRVLLLFVAAVCGRNSVDQVVADFDTGGNEHRVAVLSAVARGARGFISSPGG